MCFNIFNSSLNNITNKSMQANAILDVDNRKERVVKVVHPYINSLFKYCNMDNGIDSKTASIIPSNL